MRERSELSPECQQQLSNLRESYPSFEAFAKEYNPDTQMVFAVDERKTIMNSYSTLEMLDMALGGNTAAKWLLILVNDVNVFAGSKSMDEGQAESLAYLLAQEYKDVKFSVIQLFFYKFKCGYFGKFYGMVDPMVITCALKDFMVECENKRQQYLCEEYDHRKAEEDAERKSLRDQWDSCLNDLWKACPDDEGKHLFQSIGFITFDNENNILLLKVRREEYELIEGKYLSVFSAVINKHYPKVKVQYSLHRESVITTEPPVDKKAEHAVRQQREVQQGISSAHAVIDNKLGLGRKELDDMRYAFKRRYKYEPEEYLKLYEIEVSKQQ
jgi:hypothetical protein